MTDHKTHHDDLSYQKILYKKMIVISELVLNNPHISTKSKRFFLYASSGQSRNYLNILLF